MEKIQPYSDGKMLYNDEEKRYELNIEYVKNNFDIPFDDEVLKKRIKKNSRVVYNHLYSITNTGNRHIVEWLISHTNEYRDFIFDCLVVQIESDLASGYNDHGLFVPESKEQRDMQRLNSVCVECESIMQRSASYGGINLVYAGLLPNYFTRG